MVVLTLDQIGARLGKKTVLSNISAGPFRSGDVIAVVGPNAAGKSTLFKRICGLITGPGQVDYRYKGVSLEKSRDGMCYVPQNTMVSVALSVYEAVLLAKKQGGDWHVSSRDMAIVDQTLALLGILDLSNRPVGELSGGQMQLVSIAQALVRDPNVLLLDEPTSALDLSRSHQILALMRSLAKKRNMLVMMALHDLNDVLRYADHTLVIANGTLVAGGATQDVITEALLHDVYRVRARLELCSAGQTQVIVDGALNEYV